MFLFYLLQNFPDNEDFVLPTIKCYIKKGGRYYVEKKRLRPLDMAYFRHTSSLENPQRLGQSGFSYTYLSHDLEQALFLKGSEKLSFHTDLAHCTYDDIRAGFRMSIGSYDARAYWDYAIPWGKNEILGCFENYRLITINMETGKSGLEVDYTSGIAIQGCSFRNIQAPAEVKKIIHNNGGLQ